MARLTPTSQVRCYNSSSEGNLYRDAEGRRVLADLEGAGHFLVEVSETPLLIVRGDGSPEAFPHRFENGLTVLGLAPGAARIWASQGPVPELTSPPTSSGRVTRPGWLVAAPHGAILDGTTLPPLPPEWVAPFFHSAEGQEIQTVAALDLYERIDAWCVTPDGTIAASDWQVQNVSKPALLTSPGPEGHEHVGWVFSHLNAASWTVDLPPDHRGLRLRKRYDRFHGRQRARVLIDGIFAGWWYEPEEDRRARWGTSTFGVPENLTEGKDKIRLTIDPPAGSPLWSVGEMEVWALR